MADLPRGSQTEKGEHRRLIVEGVSVTDLRAIFGMPTPDIHERLRKWNVAQVATRDKTPIYNLKDASKALISVGIGETQEDAEIVDRILRIHHTKLPKMLSKEYWAAKLSQQRYELQAGDLWPTARIVEYCGEAFKVIRLSLQLMADAVEREKSLSEEQRHLLQTMVDSTLNDMRERLVDAFDKRGDDTGRGEEPSPEEGSDEDL